MKTRELEVPVEIMVEFADLIAEHELSNEILGSTEDGEIIVAVTYKENQRGEVLSLTELIEDHNEELED